MSDYEKLKQELEALRDKCKELEDKIEQNDAKSERVKQDEKYFTLSFTGGKARAYTRYEDYKERENNG